MERTVTTVERFTWDAKAKKWKAVEKTVTAVETHRTPEPLVRPWPNRLAEPWNPGRITCDTTQTGASITTFN